MKNIEEIENIIKENSASLISIMQGIQRKYGYLSFESLNAVSEKLGISLEEIYSVATFYNEFKFNPRAKYEVSVCLGTACYVKGSEGILDKVKEILKIDTGQMTKDGKFSIVATRCVGACGLAPVFMINEEIYGKATPKMVEEILKQYIENEA